MVGGREGGRGGRRDKTHYKISPCYQTQRSIHHRLPSRLMKGAALLSSAGTHAFLHTSTFIQVFLAYFSTRVHALCLHVCMWGGGGRNCRRGALMAPCFSRVSPGICLHPSSVFNARLHNQSSCRSFWKERKCCRIIRAAPSMPVRARLRVCLQEDVRAQKALFFFLCTKNGAARAPRIAERRLVSRGR